MTEWHGETPPLFGELRDERQRQEERFPDQHLPNGTSAMMFKAFEDKARRIVDEAAEQGELSWRQVLTEEFYEACAEEDPTKLRIELIQAAAVCLRWVEDIDR
jgi:hypothetical protein